MSEITTPSPVVKSEDTPGERDLLLSAFRAATVRSQLITNELTTIGLSLRHRKVTCEEALEWAKSEELLHWIRVGPEVRR